MGGVLAIVVAPDLRPKTVAKALQINVFTSLSPLLLPLLLLRNCDPNTAAKALQIHAFTSLSPLLLPRICDPKPVAKALQIHAFTSLSPLLLPLLLPRICDPTPSQTRYTPTHLRRCHHCCCRCCCAGFATLSRRTNVTNPRVYGTAAIVVAIVVAT